MPSKQKKKKMKNGNSHKPWAQKL